MKKKSGRSQRWKCRLCGKGSEHVGRANQTYFCSSHSTHIQEFITAKGNYGANLWMERDARLGELIEELRSFISRRG